MMGDVWPTDEMLTQACLAVQGWEGTWISAVHAAARATVDAAPTADGWVWCEYDGEVRHVYDCGLNDPPGWSLRERRSCPGPHRTLIVGPVTDGDSDG